MAQPGREHFEPAVEFVQPSPYVPRLPELRAYALASFRPGCSVAVGALDLMHRVHADFAYQSLSTQVDTPLAEVFGQRRGVCQDFAHLLIACCRCVGIPARYVSGYLYDRSNGPYDVLATHAWVEAHVGSGWLGLDPTHRRMVTDHYVRIAIGRDYGDAAPVRGFYKGTAKEKMSVKVRIRPLEEPVIAP